LAILTSGASTLQPATLLRTEYANNGQTYSYNASAYVSYGASWTSGDVIGVAWDCSAAQVTFYKNGVSQGAISSPTLSLTTNGSSFNFVPSNYNTTVTASFSVNYGQQPWKYSIPSGFLPLNTFNIAAGTVTTSGTFTGNLSTDGPMVYLNGTPTAMTINGNAVTFGTHADKLANGFKVRSSSASYNASGSNTYVATTVAEVLKYENAQPNP
jgi:hypothetical protein